MLGAGCPPDAAVLSGDFFIQDGSLCSLATTGTPIDTVKNVPTMEDCCQLCSEGAACNAYNYCANKEGWDLAPAVSRPALPMS